jgi:hypothetical protein
VRFLVDASQLIPSNKFDSSPDRILSPETYGEFGKDPSATFMEENLRPAKVNAS